MAVGGSAALGKAGARAYDERMPKASSAIVALSFASAQMLLACGGSAPAPATPSSPTTPTMATAAAPPAPSAPAAPSFDRVDGAKAHELVKAGAVLVDVRSPEEFASKHLDGAINVPSADVASHDFGGKDKAVVLYCQAGHRSEKAAQALAGQGYTHVHLLGAMSAWDAPASGGVPASTAPGK